MGNLIVINHMYIGLRKALQLKKFKDIVLLWQMKALNRLYKLF